MMIHLPTRKTLIKQDMGNARLTRESIQGISVWKYFCGHVSLFYGDAPWHSQSSQSSQSHNHS